MDRYFKQCERSLKSTELHLTGIVSMFIASKYEDVVPLRMKYVVHKIGHGKFNNKQIEAKELEILQALHFKIGAPTVKEFMDKFMVEHKNILPSKDEKFEKICRFLIKMSCHNYTIM